MPDDKEKVAEQPISPEPTGETFIEDKDFNGGFDEPAAEAKPAQETPKPKDAKPETAEAPKDEASPAPGQEPKEADQPKAQPDQTDAQKRLLERSKRFESAAQAPAAQAPQAAEPPPAEPKKPAVMPSEIADLFEIPGVKDAKINVDGQEIDARKFAEEYPEIVQASKVFGGALAEARVKAAMSAEKIGELRDAVSNLMILVQVQSEHPDALKVLNSDAYKAWHKTQAPAIQRMEESMDAADVIALFDAFKESVAKDAAEKAKASAAETKKKKDALHSEALKGGQKAQGESAPKTEDDEFAAGFEQ